MGFFKSKQAEVSIEAAPPAMPGLGDRVTVRVEGSARLWMAAVQSVGEGALSLQLEVDAYHQGKQDMILTGQTVHVAGLSGSSARVTAEARGHNGSMLLLKSAQVASDRPNRLMERIETQGKVRCTTSDRKESLVDVFDLSLGGMCIGATNTAKLGEVVSLVDPGTPGQPVRGVVVDRKNSPVRGDVFHIAFVAGTPPESLARLSECLTFSDPPSQPTQDPGWTSSPALGRSVASVA